MAKRGKLPPGASQSKQPRIPHQKDTSRAAQRLVRGGRPVSDLTAGKIGAILRRIGFSHNTDLNDLQGGNGVDEFYHLTAAEDSALAAAISAGTLITTDDASDADPQDLGTKASGVSDDYSRADHVHSDAIPASAVLADGVTGTTQANGDGSTKVATTAYADGKVEDTISDAETSKAPSQNAVYDALALKANLSSPILTGTPEAPTASPATNNTQIATTAFVRSVIELLDLFNPQGNIDCSSSPNYPAADGGHVYRVSVAGKIGGASGPTVEVNDLLTCWIDSTASGDHAAVGANWSITQVNLDPGLYALLSGAAFTGTVSITGAGTALGLPVMTDAQAPIGSNGKSYYSSDVDNIMLYSAGAYQPYYQGLKTSNITSLLSLPPSTLVNGITCFVRDFASSNDKGGGLFVWDATSSKTLHDGGTIIDPAIGVSPGASGWWTAPGSGTGVWRRLFESVVSVKWFGAKGDNSNNDLSAIQAACDKHKYVFVPEGTYLISAAIILSSNTYLFGCGEASYIYGASISDNIIATPAISETSLTQTNDIFVGDLSNTITNTASVGDLIRYQSTKSFTVAWSGPSGYVDGELFEVKSATASTVTFNEPANLEQLVTNFSNAGFYTPKTDIKIANLKIGFAAGNTSVTSSIAFNGVKRGSIKDVYTVNTGYAGISVSGCMNIDISGINCVGLGSNNGYNYGVVITNGSKYITTSNMNAAACRHGVASGSGTAIPMHCTFSDIKTQDTLIYSIDAHVDTLGFVFNNLNIDRGMYISGIKHIVSNVYSAAGPFGIYDGGSECVFSNITYNNCSRVYNLYDAINCTFTDLVLRGYDGFDANNLKGSGHVFKSVKILNEAIDDATNAATADALSLEGYSPFCNIDYAKITDCEVKGFACGFAPGSTNMVDGLRIVDCGWATTKSSVDKGAITVTKDGEYSKIDNVNIHYANANLPISTEHNIQIIASGSGSGDSVSLSNIVTTHAAAVTTAPEWKLRLVSDGHFADIALTNLVLWSNSYSDVVIAEKSRKVLNVYGHFDILKRSRLYKYSNADFTLSGITPDEAFILLEQDEDGMWWIEPYISGTVASSTICTIGIGGTTFRSYNYPVTFSQDTSNTISINRQIASAGTGNLTGVFSAAVTSVQVSGRIPLASKPTFADDY